MNTSIVCIDSMRVDAKVRDTCKYKDIVGASVYLARYDINEPDATDVLVLVAGYGYMVKRSDVELTASNFSCQQS